MLPQRKPTKEIQPTSNDAAASLKTFSQDEPNRVRLTSRLAERIVESDFWYEWLRQPALDVAEAVIRLRRRRGMTQQELADRMHTQQPAVARIESGQSNMRLSTLVELARALDAVVSLDLEPQEITAYCKGPRLKWWNDGSRRIDWNDSERVFGITVTKGASTIPSPPQRSEALSEVLKKPRIVFKLSDGRVRSNNNLVGQ